MGWLTTSEAASKWGLTGGRVLKLARDGRIPGTVQIGTRWMIPSDAEKPADGRTRAVRAAQAYKDDEFHFRIYDARPDNAFDPPLSEEEILMRQVAAAFSACKFQEAEDLLAGTKRTTNRYMRIFGLYSSCMVAFMQGKQGAFWDAYRALVAVMQQDFPFREEMKLFLLELNALLGDTNGLKKNFQIQTSRPYHPDCLSHLAAVEASTLFYVGGSSVTEIGLRSAELNCMLLENTSACALDLQTIHLYLALMNELHGKVEEKNAHMRRIFELAETYELYWLPSMEYYYLGTSMEPVLKTLSPEFAEKIRRFSKEIHERRDTFIKGTSLSNIFDMLPKNKYLFVYYAANGFGNKEVAKLMNLSEKTVKKNYSMIYSVLGLKTRKELISYYRQSMRR